MKTTVTIPKQLTHGAELVVVSRNEYERLVQQLAETQDAVVKICRGEEEYRAGKTRSIRSLADLRR